VIDTHCHLTFPDFSPPRFAPGIAGVLDEAASHGVSGCITISTTAPDALRALEVAARFPNVWSSAGVHPLYADEGPHDWATLGVAIRHEKCVAWGELGLDNHYKEPAGDVQRDVLDQQLAFIARTASEGVIKPIVVHCREAFDDLLPILRRTNLDPSRFVFHCFTGTPDDARKVLDFGALISFTGVVTYRNAREVQDAAKLVPLSRILVETDAPFLSPEPKRGVRPCAPWMASITARFLAQLRGEAWSDFHAAINANTRRFFGIDTGPRPTPGG
jgi:TatD DNase family protein